VRRRHAHREPAAGASDPYAAILGVPSWRSRVPRWLARFLFEPPDVIRTRHASRTVSTFHVSGSAGGDTHR